MRTKTEIVESFFKYLFLGIFGTLSIGACLGALVFVAYKISITPMINFVIGGAIIAVLVGLGYVYSLFIDYMDRQAAIAYHNEYKREQKEEIKMAQHWITRGVTVVEWPYIPDEKVKSLIHGYADYTDAREDDVLSFDCVLEWLKDNDRRDDKVYLETFLEIHNLETKDSINYWW